ncbi:MAG: hypothetical protein QOH89_989 [Pseudonocardiales bacterium]|nr:hypothetical protein [Pseudonocardiales bacterium]
MTKRAPARSPSLRRRIGRSAAIVGAVLVVLVATVSIATVQFVQAGNRFVYRWQPAVSATDQMLTDLVEQESSVRAYALKADAAFRADYERYVADFRADFARAQDKTAVDDELTRSMQDLRAAAQSWQRTIASPVIQRVSTGRPGGPALIAGAGAIRTFADLRDRADALTAAVQRRADEARDVRARFAIVYVIAIGLTVVMLVVIAAAIWRGLHRLVLEPIDRLADQTRRVAGGDTYKQIAPTGPPEFIALSRDVEAMRLQIAGQLARAEEIQEQLRQRTAELTRSNDDLQQFAYVASHDLSEPLRKVANFCQLLERQYGDQLDDRAKQYIDFAVDGAKRMQALIMDLLALSRVGRTTDAFVPVALDAALDRALDNLGDRITSSGARIERLTPLPTVLGDPSLLSSLFENLVSNAVKYRREDVAPEIRISAEHGGDEHLWTISVSDNGIGIDPQYAEKIFAIFQRLHLRDSYGGTGIGLAMCRKIVEFHGGQIRLEPVQSQSGAVFTFVLPEGPALAQSRD